MPETSPSDYSPSLINATNRFGGSRPPGPPLQPPGGGGTYDGMLEARVARLEADVGHIQRDVAEIKDAVKGIGKDVTDLKVNHATVSERIAHLPTYGQSFAMLTGMLALIAALVVFQGQIQKLAGLSPAAMSISPTGKL